MQYLFKSMTAVTLWMLCAAWRGNHRATEEDQSDSNWSCDDPDTSTGGFRQTGGDQQTTHHRKQIQSSNNLAINPLTPTVATLVPQSGIVCQTGLSCHL